jgi:hypothetical protein
MPPASLGIGVIEDALTLFSIARLLLRVLDTSAGLLDPRFAVDLQLLSRLTMLAKALHCRGFAYSRLDGWVADAFGDPTSR